MKILKFILAGVILLIGFSILSAGNDTASVVEKMIKSKTDKAVTLIKDKKLKEEEKKKKIFQIVSPLFDIEIMSKLTLGKKYWPKLTDEQKKKFIELFRKRIKMVYLDRVTIAGNLSVTYKPAFMKGKRRVFVPSVFSSNGKDYSVLFKLWRSGKEWKIYDVEVEGVSIIRTYRSQFYDILSKGTIDDLFKKLENATANK
jgi:phospholipid transport system substrate-binding protein